MLGLGVVGVGDVAQRDYLPELPRLAAKARPVVACSRSAGRAAEVAERFGIGRWTTSYEEVVTAGDVDAVLNLTPFEVHEEVTLAALGAGKHVYSEKPCATSAAGATRLLDAERKAGRIVVAAPSVLVFPQLQRAKEVLASGRLGKVHNARGWAFGGVPPWVGYLSDPSPFFAETGGPLVDMAVYPLHTLSGLLGPVRRVAACSNRTRDSFEVVDGHAASRRVQVEVDDNWQVLLELDTGVLASLEANNCAASAAGPQLELQGEAGTMGLDLLDVSEPIRYWSAAGAEEEAVPHVRASGPDHLLGVEHLVDCILEGRRPVLGLEHAAHIIEVLDAAKRSARQGEFVEVTSRPTTLSPATAGGSVRDAGADSR